MRSHGALFSVFLLLLLLQMSKCHLYPRSSADTHTLTYTHTYTHTALELCSASGAIEIGSLACARAFRA